MEEKVQRLSEGMDFIEEACGYNEPLQYTEINESIISESEGSKPSPYKVLGRCSGVFQPIGEYSRNKRIYSKDLWPRILEGEELKSRLAHRAVFGCLGHADKLVDDKDIQEGKVSHIVTVLEVRKDEKNNPYLYGELEILDTPAGRILEAMYKGGADLYVSSRAAGRLTPIPGDPENRMLVSPSNYFFHCFDVVARPGFVKARPTFECAPANESVSEATINELDDKTIESDLDKRQDQMYDAEAHAKENPKAAAEAKKKFEHAVDLAQKRADRNDEILDQDKHGNPVHYKNESEEIAVLRSQIDQLAKILEKVVDDVYEEEGIVEAKDDIDYEFQVVRKNALANPNAYGGKYTQKDTKEARKEYEEDKKAFKKVPVEKSKKEDKKELRKAAIPAFLKIVAESNISEEALSEIIDMIKGSLK